MGWLESGVPARDHQLNRSILSRALLGNFKAFATGSRQNSVEGVALGQFGQEAFDGNGLLPEIEISD